MSDFINTIEVAAMLRTTPETVRYWRHMGTGPKSFKIGRRVLYNMSDVDEWMRAKGASTAHVQVPASATNQLTGDSLTLGRMEESLAQMVRTLASIEALLARADARVSRGESASTYLDEARRPIEDLGLSMTTYNAAKRLSAHTFNDLCETSPIQFDHPTVIREVAKAVIGRISELPEDVQPYLSGPYARWGRIATQPV